MTSSIQVLSDTSLDAVTGGWGGVESNIFIGKIVTVQKGFLTQNNGGNVTVIGIGGNTTNFVTIGD